MPKTIGSEWIRYSVLGRWLSSNSGTKTSPRARGNVFNGVCDQGRSWEAASLIKLVDGFTEREGLWRLWMPPESSRFHNVQTWICNQGEFLIKRSWELYQISVEFDGQTGNSTSCHSSFA